MAKEDLKNTQNSSALGKGYSYFLALVLTFVMILQALDIRSEGTHSGFRFEASTKEIPVHVFIPVVGLIAGILKLDTDSLAMAIGKFLDKGQG